VNIAGKISDDVLRNVFMYISEQQVSGSFHVSDGNSERILFLRPGKVQLYSIGERKRIMLGEILTLMGVITSENLEQALFVQKNTGMKIGDILVEKGNIAPADLDKGLKNIIFEEVYDLLFWEQAGFSFVEESRNPLFEDPELRHIETDIDVHQFMREVSEKINEIDVLKQWVPDSTAVYIIKNKVKEADCLAKVPGYSCRMVLDLLTGENDVGTICRKLKISQYEIFRVLSLLLSEGLIRELDAESVRAKGDEYLSARDGEKALEMFEIYAEMGGDKNALAEKIGLAHELAGNDRQAAVAYSEYGETCYSQGDYNEAFTYFNKAVDLWRDNADIILHYAELLKEQNHTDEWLKNVEKGARICVQNGEHDRALELYRMILKAVPDAPGARREISKLITDRMSLEEQKQSIMCPVCEKKYSRDTEECSECRQKLTHSCLCCGRAIGISDSECPECGGDPHQTPESSQYVKKETSLLDTEDTAGTGQADPDSFWNDKIDIYTKQARESSDNLDFSEAKTKLQTAMLIAPEDEGIKEEMKKVEHMAAKKEVADGIDRGMVAYYGQKWRSALKCYKKVIKEINSEYPAYSDLYSQLQHVKKTATRRNIVIAAVGSAVIIGALALYIPFEISRRREIRVSGLLASLRQKAHNAAPEVFRDNFCVLRAMEEEHAEHPELKERIQSLYREQRTAYIHQAEERYTQALNEGKEGRYESGVKKLKRIKPGFPDISETELSCIGRIEPAILLFTKKAKERDEQQKKRTKALEYLSSIRDTIQKRKYAEAAEAARILASFISGTEGLLKEPEMQELRSLRNTITENVSKAESVSAAVKGFIKKGCFERARAQISEARTMYAGSDLVDLLPLLSRELEKAQQWSQDECAKAQALYKKGLFNRSSSTLNGILKRYPEIDNRKEIEKVLTGIGAYVSEAEDAVRHIQKLINEGDIHKAFTATRLAKRKYADPPVKAVQNLAIPVYITSKPSRVAVSYIGGGEAKHTPLVMLIPQGAEKEVSFSRKGFSSRTYSVGTDKWSICVRLEKTTLWPPLSVSFAVKALPVYFKDHVILPLGTGVLAFNAAKGKIAWKINLYQSRKTIPKFDGKGGDIYVGSNDFWEITAQPLIWNGTVVIGGRNGKLYFIDPETGSIRKTLPDKKEKSGYGCIARRVAIKKIPLLMNEDIVFFGNYDKHLYAVSQSSGKVKWRVPLGEQSMSPPLMWGEKVWVGMKSGRLMVRGTADGYSIAAQKIDDTSVMECVKLENSVLVPSKGGTLISMEGEAARIWKYPLGSEITAVPLFTNGKIYCPIKKRLCAVINAHTGKLLWMPDINESASCTPQTARNRVYVGSDTNCIFCIDEIDRSIDWKYEIEGCPFSLIYTGNYLVVVTLNGKIYTFNIID